MLQKQQLKATVLTIFPDLFSSFLSTSLIEKCVSKGILSVELINFRNFADPPHYKVDDEVYGGGAGMLLKPEPLMKAIESVEADCPSAKRILLSPSGTKFNQEIAQELAQEKELIFVCGRYEGVDQRVIDQKIDLELSIGDFVCMGGEIPTMLVIESVLRLIDSAIGNPDSLQEESFSIKHNGNTLIEGPQYTRPAEFRGLKVPEVLLSGDHQKNKRMETNASNQKNEANLNVILLHDEMHDKEGELITTSLTMIDLHDIARSSRTYGVNTFYIAHPAPALRKLADTLKSHWETGHGAEYNPNRKEALETAKVVTSLDDAIHDLDYRYKKLPKLIATSAKPGADRSSFSDINNMLQNTDEQYLLMLGTGWGMSDPLLDRSDYFLEPVDGAGDYNHLSVRSACAIMLDRLLA